MEEMDPADTGDSEERRKMGDHGWMTRSSGSRVFDFGKNSNSSSNLFGMYVTHDIVVGRDGSLAHLRMRGCHL